MPSTPPREHEAKFQVNPATYAALLSQPFASTEYTLRPIGQATHTDTYLDTPDYQLLRHGVVLRVRGQGATYEAALKSLMAERKGAIQSRMEVTIPLPPDSPPLDSKFWPDALLDHLKAFAVKARQLRPVLVVRQLRQKAKLYATADDTPLAEWSLDKVWIDTTGQSRPAPVADEGFGKALFHELEIELLAPTGSNSDSNSGSNTASNTASGDAGINTHSPRHALFESLVRQIGQRYALMPSFSSKFVRGLEAMIAYTHGNNPMLTPTMTLEEAGRLLLHQQLFQIMLHEDAVRKDSGPRYVHDVRVAIRRGRAVLQLCDDLFPAKQLRPIVKGLKRLGRVLGVVRDLDVALSNLRAFRRGQPKALHKGIQLLRGELKSQRVHARADLMALLDSRKHRKFIADALRFCVTKSSQGEGRKAASKGNVGAHDVVPRQVRHTLPSRILAAFEAVRAYETAFANTDLITGLNTDLNTHLPPLETFHALRKQARHLRYVVEFAQHLLGDDGAVLAKELRVHQEFLGELNDAYVEQLRLQRWAETSPPDTPLRHAIATRLGNTDAAIDKLASGVPAALALLVNYQSRLTLTKALARL